MQFTGLYDNPGQSDSIWKCKQVNFGVLSFRTKVGKITLKSLSSSSCTKLFKINFKWIQCCTIVAVPLPPQKTTTQQKFYILVFKGPFLLYTKTTFFGHYYIHQSSLIYFHSFKSWGRRDSKNYKNDYWRSIWGITVLIYVPLL